MGPEGILVSQNAGEEFSLIRLIKHSYVRWLACHLFREQVASTSAELQKVRENIQEKNPAYGRHLISCPMRIEALIFLFPLASIKGLIASPPLFVLLNQ